MLCTYIDFLSVATQVNTKFLLFTRHNADSEQIFAINNSTSMISSHFDPQKLTKVIIHGFGSSCYRVWVREMRVALLTMVGPLTSMVVHRGGSLNINGWCYSPWWVP